MKNLRGGGFHNKFMVISPVPLGDLACIRQFVETFIFESDRKGLNRPRTFRGHQCGDGTGIYSATEKYPKGHIGDQSDANRLPEQSDEFRPDFLFRRGGFFSKPARPSSCCPENFFCLPITVRFTPEF